MPAWPFPFTGCLSESDTKNLMPGAALGRSPMPFLTDKTWDLCLETSHEKGISEQKEWCVLSAPTQDAFFQV